MKHLYCTCQQLSVKGYNDKQHIILKKIMEKMVTFEIDDKRFEIIKEAVSWHLSNMLSIIVNIISWCYFIKNVGYNSCKYFLNQI